jgi:glycosyl transferase, family 25
VTQTTILSGQVRAFVINLDHSTERLAAIQKQAEVVRLPLTRVPGVLGRAVDLANTPAVDVRGYALRHGRDISMNEVGCYLSHLRALDAFLASGAAFGIILEDDAGLPAGYLDLIQRLLEKQHAWDIVKLSAFHSGTPLLIEPIGQGQSLGIPLSRHMNANNVLYSRAAAEKMVRALTPMQLPFDHALERAWLFGLRLRVVTPSPCPPDTGHASTIADSVRYHLVWYQRLPCMGFRLVTELSRFAFGIAHYLRYKLTGF